MARCATGVTIWINSAKGKVDDTEDGRTNDCHLEKADNVTVASQFTL